MFQNLIEVQMHQWMMIIVATITRESEGIFFLEAALGTWHEIYDFSGWILRDSKRWSALI